MQNPKTLLQPFLGVFQIQLDHMEKIPPICFFVMKNLLPHDAISEEDVFLCFDMKGSTNARQSLDDPSILQNLMLAEKDQLKGPLKDVDFSKGIGHVRVSNSSKVFAIEQQSAKDSQFLLTRNFMDYSVLLFIVYKVGQEAEAEMDLEE